MKLPLKNSRGETVGEAELADSVFGIEPNEAVLHQALVAHLANRRQGNAKTKTRSEVQGSTRKLYRQKGTGRARRGSIRSPILRGGGTTFGPRPRSYRQALPKKMRRLAVRSALSAKARDGELTVLDELALPEPKTREMVKVLASLIVPTSTLIATGEVDAQVVRSAHNLPAVATTPAALLNVAEILSHRNLVMTVAAVRRAEALWAVPSGQGSSRRRQPRPAAGAES